MSQGQGIKLGLSSRHGRVQFLLEAPEQCQRVIAMQLANAYPRGQVEISSPITLQRKQSSWLRLSPDILLLKRIARLPMASRATSSIRWKHCWSH